MDRSSIDDPPSSQEPPALTRRKSSFALFRHQVAGHLPLFWSHGTICKPAFPTEIEFYRSVNRRLPAIIPYIPKFIEVLQLVQLSEIADSFASGKGENQEAKQDLEKEDPEIQKWLVMGVNSDLKRKINQLDNRYLVLQDLTSGFKRPCILDLKLGTRQHGVNASQAKIASKTKKVNSTTSRTLGLRLCGMQVYHPTENSFISKNKHFGRSLNDRTFSEALRSFFFNGARLRTDCIREILEKLRGLYDVLCNQSSFLFYACSILVIYEGSNNAKDLPACSAFQTQSCGAEGIGLVASSPHIYDHLAEMCYDGDSSSSTGNLQDTFSRRKADMRLIDFAHTYPLDDGAQDEDSGILLGVETLMNMLRNFLEDEEQDYQVFPVTS